MQVCRIQPEIETALQEVARGRAGGGGENVM